MFSLYSKKQLVIMSFLGMLLFHGCNTKNKEQDTYSILSIVTKELSFEFPIPPPTLQENMSREDSISTMQTYKEIVQEYKNRKQIVAIVPYSTPAYLQDFDKSKLGDQYQLLAEDLSINQSKIDYKISKIHTRPTDSIIVYTDKLIEKNRTDYIDFDLLVNFSNIKFNEEHTLAVVVGSAGTGNLAGFSTLFLLNKTNGKWKIFKQIGLSIS